MQSKEACKCHSITILSVFASLSSDWSKCWNAGRFNFWVVLLSVKSLLA